MIVLRKATQSLDGKNVPTENNPYPGESTICFIKRCI